MPHDTTRVIDLGEATALLTLGFDLIELEPSNTGKHKVFIFHNLHPNSSTRNVVDVIDEYKRRKLQVDAFSFYRSGKEIKNRIHESNETGSR